MISQDGTKAVQAFQEKFPTKAKREKALRSMSDEEIEILINSCGTAQGKNYYTSFLEKKYLKGVIFQLEREISIEPGVKSRITIKYPQKNKNVIIESFNEWAGEYHDDIYTFQTEDIKAIRDYIRGMRQAFDGGEFEMPLLDITDGWDDTFFFSDKQGRVRRFRDSNFFESYKGIKKKTKAGEILSLCSFIEKVLKKYGIRYFSLKSIW